MTYSYFVPAENITIGVTEEVPLLAPTMTGTVRDMVVACDMSRRVYGFIGGAQSWMRDYPTSWPRGIDLFEGMLFIAAGDKIEVVNPKTGHLHRVIAPQAGIINSVRVSRWNGFVWVALAFDINGVGSVKIYKMDNLELTLHLSNSQSASHPRCAVVVDGWVYVADTFGHRVYAIDIASGGGLRDTTDVYYPNTIDPVASGEVLICAEHENRVFKWTVTSRTMVFCAPVSPFNNIAVGKDQVVTMTPATYDPASTFTPKKSLCAKESAGINTLYSPNSARYYGSNTLIADCDNHRVVVVSGGVVTTEVTGFNNPVNAVLIGYI